MATIFKKYEDLFLEETCNVKFYFLWRVETHEIPNPVSRGDNFCIYCLVLLSAESGDNLYAI